MPTLNRTNSEDPGFRSLVSQLDAYLRIVDGDEHSFFAQYNKIDTIKSAVVAYQDGIPVGCGAVKEYAEDTMEVKRMFVLPGQRGKGIASLVLSELENWCRELGYQRCILETSIRLPEAILLYERRGYSRIPNYGQYEKVESSVCFEKMLMMGAENCEL
ncbi:MAG: GNAT family N-acetyltransferase [Sphingobacteriales bacterium]|nr:GNAT family N-acetyltransferase [Sphingobacteriales bacterium]